MTQTVLKAVRGEVARLAAKGSEWLVHASRKMGKRVTISVGVESALLDELRARAALALLQGMDPDLPPRTLDGATCKGVKLSVDPEQFEDFWPTDKVRPVADAPRESEW